MVSVKESLKSDNVKKSIPKVDLGRNDVSKVVTQILRTPQPVQITEKEVVKDTVRQELKPVYSAPVNPELVEEKKDTKEMSFLSNLLKPKEGGTFVGNLLRGVGINKSPVPTAGTMSTKQVAVSAVSNTDYNAAEGWFGDLVKQVNYSPAKPNNTQGQTLQAGFPGMGSGSSPVMLFGIVAVILLMLWRPKS